MNFITGEESHLINGRYIIDIDMWNDPEGGSAAHKIEITLTDDRTITLRFPTLEDAKEKLRKIERELL